MVIYHSIAIARNEVIQHSSIRTQHIALLASLASAIAGIVSLTQITSHCTACVFEVGSRKSRQPTTCLPKCKVLKLYAQTYLHKGTYTSRSSKGKHSKTYPALDKFFQLGVGPSFTTKS